MKYFTLLFAFLMVMPLQAQITDIKKKDSCYFKYDKNGERIVTQQQRRYAEWECGKLAGVIDCSTELDYSPELKVYFKKSTDNVNLAGVGKPYTGKCESCHMNGTLHGRITFLNGKQDGIDTTYFRSGCPERITSHVQGAENGTWYQYFDTTNYLKEEMNFSVGEKHGKHIEFRQTRDSNNVVGIDTVLWENYKYGILDGTKRSYYRGSRIKREVEYKDGVFDGDFKIYNLKGVVIEELNYKEGEKDGEAKYYYDDGQLLKTENWKMGIKNGEFKIFYYQGHIQESENYKKGNKEGWFEKFYPDSTPKQRALYKKDELIEEHRYDEHGRETYTFGAQPDSGDEDDAMPTAKKKKKKKKKEE